MTSPQFRKTASRKMGGAVFGRVLMLWSFLLGSSLFGSALEKSHVSSGPRVGRHSAGRAHVVAVHRQPSDGHGGDSLPLPASSGSRARARVGLGGPGRGSAAVRQPSSSREDGFVDLELGGNLHSAAGRASASRVSERNGLLLRAAGSAASAALTLGEAVGRRALSAASRVGEAVDRFNLSDDQEIEDLREFNAFEQKLADCWDNNSDGAVSLKSFWFGPHMRQLQGLKQQPLFNRLPPPDEAIQIGIFDIAPLDRRFILQEEARKLWKAVGDLVKSFHFPTLQRIIEEKPDFGHAQAGRCPRNGVRTIEMPPWWFRDEQGFLRDDVPFSLCDIWSRTRGPLSRKDLLPQNIRQSREGKRVSFLARSYSDIYWKAILDRPDTDIEAAIKVGAGPRGMRVDDVHEGSSNGTSTAMKKKISWTVDYEFQRKYTDAISEADHYNTFPPISCRSTWEWSFLVDFVESAPRLLRVDIKEMDFEVFEVPFQRVEAEHHRAGSVPLRSLSFF
ncbi:unnamed protein product [Amoebophrya sp. A120]|nr:unnamed protein product [Amoebophrya sp. A120]|eukprot:GSA120T00014952001.1